MSACPALTPDLELAAMMADYYDDPERFVDECYPWGEPGELEHEPGPDDWQREILRAIGAETKARNFNGCDAVQAIRVSRASGHGIGKSTLIAWLANWIMSTRPDSQGTVTANTFNQIETKTWPAIERWTKLCITRDWWVVGARGLYHREAQEKWFLNCQTCNEENSEAFAGQHAKNSTSYYLLDESSAIPAKTWEVLEGGLTDGEPMVFAFGNPTRNTGVFYEINFGNRRHRWNHGSIDSRTCRFSNKAQIEEWIQDYGIDSDFCRVRILGLPPNQAEDQLISRDLVRGAKARQVTALDDDPLIAGVDVPDGGNAWFIVRFRRGVDGRNVPAPIRMPGSRVDRQQMVTTCAELLRDGVTIPGKPGRHKIAAMFVDSAFGSPIVERLHTLHFRNVEEINFGGKSPDPHYANMRAYMWAKMLKEWLERGAIDPNDVKLEIDLTGPGWHFNRTNAIVVESKQDMRARGVPSPDDGDALCFVAGTRIRTTRGEVAIENVRIGDAVLTPFGPSPVVKLHQSDAHTLTYVRFSHGKTLLGKGEHRIFTFSRGKIRLDALALTDEVEVFSRWRLALWRIVSLCSTGARNSGFKRLASTFSPGTPMHRKDFFIAGSGWTITDRFRKAWKSIISMMTGAITHLRILACAPEEITSASICWRNQPIPRFASDGSNIWFSQGKEPLSGTVLPRESRGTASTESEPGKTGSLLMPSAQSAEGCIRLSSLRDRNSAPGLAAKLLHFGAISRMHEHARSAVRNFRLIVTGRRPVVPVCVRTGSAPPTKTYNLTLAKHNAYYANGILVFNCLTFARPVAPVKAEPEPDPFGDFAGPGSWMA